MFTTDTYDRLTRLYGERFKRPDWAKDKTGRTMSDEPRLPVASRKEVEAFFTGMPDATDEDAINWLAGQVGTISKR